MSKKISWSGLLLLSIPVLVFASSYLSNSDLVAQAKNIPIWYIPGQDTGSVVSCSSNLAGNRALLCQMRQAFTWNSQQPVIPENSEGDSEATAQSESTGLTYSPY